MDFEIQKTRYLQSIGNNAYIYKFQCMHCLALNNGLINRQTIDRELEDKQTYEIEDICKTCKREVKIELSKEVKYIIKE